MPYIEKHCLHLNDHSNNVSFRLATTDLMVPPIYSTYGLVFQLDKTCDKRRIVHWLKNGLEMTLSQYQHLTGTVKKNELGDFSVVKTTKSGVRFEVQWLDEEDFVSYSELEAHHFSTLAFGNIDTLCVHGM